MARYSDAFGPSSQPGQNVSNQFNQHPFPSPVPVWPRFRPPLLAMRSLRHSPTGAAHSAQHRNAAPSGRHRRLTGSNWPRHMEARTVRGAPSWLNLLSTLLRTASRNARGLNEFRRTSCSPMDDFGRSRPQREAKSQRGGALICGSQNPLATSPSIDVG